MNNLKIGTRLLLGFAAVLALMCISCATALWQARVLHNDTEFFSSHVVPSLRAIRRVISEIDDTRRWEFRHVMNQEPAGKEDAEKNIDAHHGGFEAEMRAYESLVSDKQDRQLMHDMRKAADAYFASWPELRALSRLVPSDPTAHQRAAALLAGPSYQAFRNLNAAAQAWWAYNEKLGQARAKASNETYRSAVSIMLGLAAAALALGIASALLITRSVTRPIREAARLTQAVAEGDLSCSVSASGRDEASELLKNLSSMTLKLREIVGQVRTGSMSVATASDQMAQGNQDLSSRTEQQASALQQTAAAMQELGTTVSQNVDSASQADRLAKSASAVATKGGAVVREVVDTMSGIDASSRKIADIIGVIDGIAFQTNILALNAAVEAARAGTHGRGFAVVAGEVRTLAQRSAEAAKEIKGLVNASVEQVERGSTLVLKAGSTMAEIVKEVRRVTDIMGEISQASVRQRSGVQQVGEAVLQMDQATQQNAALVEESAAASESLRRQASQLVQAVSVFRLGAGTHHGAEHTPTGVEATESTAARKAATSTVANEAGRPPHQDAHEALRRPRPVVPNETWESF